MPREAGKAESRMRKKGRDAGLADEITIRTGDVHCLDGMERCEFNDMRHS